jgi:hypothetical protein
VDPNGFNPRSHERGIDGSTTSETSLTKYSEAASRQAATSFSQIQPESRTQNQLQKFDKSHHHQKKIQDPLLPQNTKDDEKKILKIQKHRIKKKLQKKSTKFDHEKKSTKTYKNQKVSGKRRKPTTSLQQSTGLKRLVASTTSIIPYRPQTEETDSKRRHRMGDAPRATS